MNSSWFVSLHGHFAIVKLMSENKHFTLFVASHDSSLLSKVPEANYIRRVELERIDLPEPFRGELMAESRIYFHHGFRTCDSKYVGLCSPRWNERFPSWPKINELDKPTFALKGRQILAPQALATKTTNVPNWIKSQDLVHPGISKFLFEIWNEIGDQSFRKSWLPMGNTYILPHEVFVEVIRKWDYLFPLVSKNHFNDLDFSHKCIKCGFESTTGVGRWKANRQASYLLERMIALIFASTKDIVTINLNMKGVRNRKSPISTTLGLPWTALTYGKVSQSFMDESRCNHLHFGPGKR
jgi:hypothetical protein